MEKHNPVGSSQGVFSLFFLKISYRFTRIRKPLLVLLASWRWPRMCWALETKDQTSEICLLDTPNYADTKLENLHVSWYSAGNVHCTCKLAITWRTIISKEMILKKCHPGYWNKKMIWCECCLPWSSPTIDTPDLLDIFVLSLSLSLSLTLVGQFP